MQESPPGQVLDLRHGVQRDFVDGLAEVAGAELEGHVPCPQDALAAISFDGWIWALRRRGSGSRYGNRRDRLIMQGVGERTRIRWL